MLVKENYNLGMKIYSITSNYSEFFHDFNPWDSDLTSAESIMSIHQMITDLEAGVVAPYIEILQDIATDCADEEDTARTISDLVEYLNEYKADVIVLAGFLSKLSESLCEEYKDRILNVHPALIPSFCGKGFYGLHVHEAALAYGVKVSGATVHLVDSEYDHGRIIMQKAVEVCEGDTPETLQQRIMVQAEHIILPQAVEKLCAELGE